MIREAHWSEPGGHANNQDAFAVCGHPLDPDWQLCVVADGQGGQLGAAEAAQLACRTTLSALEQLPPGQLLRSGVWLSLLRQVDLAVASAAQAGFTTLVALALKNNVVVGASSGDSAAMAFCAGREAEVLTRQQRKNPPVGSGGAIFIPFTSVLMPLWTVLALTDGVWKYAGWDLLQRPGAERPEELIQSVRARAALPRTGQLQDDFTLVVFQEE